MVYLRSPSRMQGLELHAMLVANRRTKNTISETLANRQTTVAIYGLKLIRLTQRVVSRECCLEVVASCDEGLLFGSCVGGRLF